MEDFELEARFQDEVLPEIYSHEIDELNETWENYDYAEWVFVTTGRWPA